MMRMIAATDHDHRHIASHTHDVSRQTVPFTHIWIWTDVRAIGHSIISAHSLLHAVLGAHTCGVL